MAKEAGLSERQYWDQIIKACFLEGPDPIKKWHEVFVQNTRIIKNLIL